MISITLKKIGVETELRYNRFSERSSSNQEMVVVCDIDLPKGNSLASFGCQMDGRQNYDCKENLKWMSHDHLAKHRQYNT